MRRLLVAVSSLALCSADLGPLVAQPAPGMADFDPRTPATETRVMRGETLNMIAERTRSPLIGLIRINKLEPPYALSPGQTLLLPPLKVHVVVAGETFSDVAKRYDVDERSLAVFNQLPRPVKVVVGQHIVLPPLVLDQLTGLEPQDLVDLLALEIAAGRQVTGTIPGQIVQPRRSPPPAPKAPPASAPITNPPRQMAENTEAVSPDLTSRPPAKLSPPPIARPAELPGVEAGNAISPPAPVTPSRPPPAPVTQPKAPAAANPVPREPMPKAPPVKKAVPKAASPTTILASPKALPKGQPAGSRQMASLPPPPVRPTGPQPKMPPNSAGTASEILRTFAWPVRGRILETFGTKGDFRTYDGIEIEAPANTPFKAADAGVVAYVGNQLPGYGWLVLIRHGDNYMTAYAYANSVSVREGQAVSRGQVIGVVGMTGRAPTPRLHFQVRRDTRPVDPVLYLQKQATRPT